MQTDLAFPRHKIVQLCGNAWKRWWKRRARLSEFDNSDQRKFITWREISALL